MSQEPYSLQPYSLDLQANHTRFGSRAWRYLDQCLTEFIDNKGNLSGYYRDFLGGPWVQRFEEAFAKYIGTKYAIGVSSGTAALHCAITATVSRFAKVLTSPMTFVASASAIVMSGCEPIFGDIDQFLTLDLENYRASLVNDPAACVAVHLLGHPCSTDLAYRPHLPIIEDCAQSLGALYKGQMTGSRGIASCFSFQETKSLTTLGEGGMVCTNHEKIADKCRNIRNHGEKYAKDSTFLGYNYRMTEPEAAFGLGQLEEYPDTLNRQVACANIVRNNLPDGFYPVPTSMYAEPSYFIVAALVPEKFPRAEWCKKAMAKFGWGKPSPGQTVGTGYTELVCDLPYFASRYSVPEVPKARDMMKKMVWFDLHRFVRDPEVVKARMDALKEVKV